jgi:hypothetical protein
MGVQERDDLPAALRGGDAHHFLFGSGYLKRVGEAGVVGQPDDALPTELVYGGERADLLEPRGALPRDDRGEGIRLQAQRFLCRRHWGFVP